MGGVVSAYEMGLVRRLPDPPIGPFNSEKVDASDYAYERMETPDGLLMTATYVATAILAGAGSPRRAAERPWLPVALAGKGVFDVGLNAKLAQEEWAENEALCVYCQAANVASLAIAALALPEAARADYHLGGSRDERERGGERPRDARTDVPQRLDEERPPPGAERADALLDKAMEDTFPASDPPAFTGTTVGSSAARPGS